MGKLVTIGQLNVNQNYFMAVKMVVFDMAGTTVVDLNFVAIAFQKAFARQDIVIPAEAVNPLMGYEKRLAIQMMLKRLGIQFDDKMVETIYNDFIGEMIDFYEYSPEVK